MKSPLSITNLMHCVLVVANNAEANVAATDLVTSG